MRCGLSSRRQHLFRVRIRNDGDRDLDPVLAKQRQERVEVQAFDADQTDAMVPQINVALPGEQIVPSSTQQHPQQK